MDVHQKLDEIVASVGSAKAMPMSASCVINRGELLARLEELRGAFPDSLAEATRLLGGREEVVADAHREAQRIVEAARAERGSLVENTHIAREARGEADRILAEARREAAEVRAEADDYVDSKLANFEVVLGKTIDSVGRGREKLLGAGRDGDPELLLERADAYVEDQFAAIETVLRKTLEAVGRGRNKLTGHRPIDELAEHMAAGEGRPPEMHPLDLAMAAEAGGAMVAPGAPSAGPPARGTGDFSGWVTGTEYPAPDTGWGPGGDIHRAAATHAGGDWAAAGNGGYPDYTGDPYGAPAGSPAADGSGYGGHSGHGGTGTGTDQEAASLFDTGFIDPEQLRRYEQGR
ncbi:cell division initiation protein [Streptomyces sp. ST2-7A]|uniref:cell division initiation protein n=1 Tax=Streptomyces sp. ST2-7A TaxID=2907214 RepID=UPI001F3A5FEE|nr:cell division initiation protein [Streptomyces sp. ST2-7A]MCE7079928.1 cell division initiation protein [Streptomyces sp. ST2-7A]